MACAASEGDDGQASVQASNSAPGQGSAPAASDGTSAEGSSKPPTPSSTATTTTPEPTAPATTQVEPPLEASTGAATDEPQASTSPVAPEASATLSGAPAGEGGANDPPSGGEGGEGAAPDDSSSEGPDDENSDSPSSDGEQDAGPPETEVTEPNPDLEPFSFFVTSLEAMRTLSQNDNGFGGDLRYGEADGLSGADKICSEIAELSMAGAASKQWRAFLSVAAGPDGGQVNAIDRIGEGPWYDRLGRLVSEDLTGLLNERPVGDAEVVEDLPNELGEPNSFAGGVEMDNHDTLTGSDETGQLDGGTCADWTSTTSTEAPLAGHSWPARSGQHWIRSHGVHGCGPSVVDGEGSFGMGEEGGGVGDGGGYGGIYCFALNP